MNLQEGKMANLREKAQTILDEFADEGVMVAQWTAFFSTRGQSKVSCRCQPWLGPGSADDGSATNTQVNGNQAGNNTDNNANSLSQLGERTEEAGMMVADLACPKMSSTYPKSRRRRLSSDTGHRAPSLPSVPSRWSWNACMAAWRANSGCMRVP